MKIGPSICLLSLSLLSSCSWYKELERSLVEDDIRQAKKNQVVPRQKYEELMVKYEELSKKYESLSVNPQSTNQSTSLVQEIQSSSTPSETVDLFGTSGNEMNQMSDLAANAAAATVIVPEGMEEQVSLYRRGLILRQTNPGEATKVFQQLELKSAPSIKVRSKQQIGEMLFDKGQYDLALQVFEDVISNYSYSGVVLDALRLSVICTEKLGIMNKKEQYASVLHDVFESR